MAGKPEQIIKDGEKTRFKPGQTGNPNGRPPGVPNTATRLQRFLNLVQKGKNPVTKEDEEFTVAELMDLQQIAKAMKGDTAAWEKILNRLEGMPKQTNETTIKTDGANAETLDAAKVREMVEILKGNAASDTQTTGKRSKGS